MNINDIDGAKKINAAITIRLRRRGMSKQQRYHKKYAKYIGLALRYATKENLAEIAEIIQFRNRDFAGEKIEAMEPVSLSDFLRKMEGKK